MFRPLAFVATLVLPLAAQADCSQPVLSCTFDSEAKAVLVCLEGDTLTYEFGTPGMTADLKLSQPLSDGTYWPWPGVGNSVWESVDFWNAEYVYEVWSALERTPDNPLHEGGIRVIANEEIVSELVCDTGSVTDDFRTLSETMYDGGYCWNRADQFWSATGGCDD